MARFRVTFAAPGVITGMSGEFPLQFGLRLPVQTGSEIEARHEGSVLAAHGRGGHCVGRLGHGGLEDEL